MYSETGGAQARGLDRYGAGTCGRDFQKTSVPAWDSSRLANVVAVGHSGTAVGPHQGGEKGRNGATGGLTAA